RDRHRHLLVSSGRAAPREHTVEPPVDPFDEVRRLRNLVRGREQVSEPLLGGDHLVIQRYRQPPDQALRQRGDREVQTYSGRILLGPLLGVRPCPLGRPFITDQQI